MRTRHHPRRERTPMPGARGVAALAVAGLLAACLTLGLGGRLADPADAGGHRPSITSVAGDDLPAAVLPVAISLVVAMFVVGLVLAPPRRSSQRVSIAVRNRAPPRPNES